MEQDGDVRARPDVIVRADASAAIGAGHLMRAIALGRALEPTANVTLATSCDRPELLEHTRGTGIRLHNVPQPHPHADDLQRISELAGESTCRWAVVDGYHFDEQYLDGLRAQGFRVMMIDDSPRLPSYAAVDVLLDQNLGALRQAYVAPRARLLLGPRFTLLRGAFVSAERAPRAAGPRRVLVTFGGSDVADVTERVLHAIAGLPDLEVTAVIGAANQRAARLTGLFAAHPGVQIVQNVQDLIPFMASTDVAIAGVGITLWELAKLGVPTLAVSSTEIHRRIAPGIDEYGAHRWIGDAATLTEDGIRTALHELLADDDAQAEMSRLGRALIDGRGAMRVAEAITRPETDWLVRRAAPADAEAVWEIATDQSVRAMAFDPTPFPFASHALWFASRLHSDSNSWWVIERDGTVAGFTRYDRTTGEHAEIDVAVAPAARGRGLGTKLLADSWRKACQELGVSTARGVVFTENAASRSTFASAGFRRVRTAEIRGRSCELYERSVAAEHAS
jgi:UDP-2,4-diacetamido-2,4,6-trideoxy-beta-L-altropyranose hydrolase